MPKWLAWIDSALEGLFNPIKQPGPAANPAEGPSEVYWAYEFACERSLEAMLAVLNDIGPWTWEERDSAWYGDYLSAYPEWGRVRIHDVPYQERRYSVLVKMLCNVGAEREASDRTLRDLLTKAGAQDLREIEPYD